LDRDYDIADIRKMLTNLSSKEPTWKITEKAAGQSVAVRYRALCGHEVQGAGFLNTSMARQFIARQSGQKCLGCE
jgi:hypothetical protein